MNSISSASSRAAALWWLMMVLFSGVVAADHYRASIFGYRGGEPHVTTWNGEGYEFHPHDNNSNNHNNGNDYALLHNPTYANGVGLNVYIRTKINDYWSYVETAVLQVGDVTIEVRGSSAAEGKYNRQQQSPRYWINGEEGMQLKRREQFHASLANDVQCSVSQQDQQLLQVNVDLGNDNMIVMEAFQEFVRVDVHIKDAFAEDSFGNSLGLLGSFPDGVKVGRDKTTLFDNDNQFAKEWKVVAADSGSHKEDPSLFHSYDKNERLSMQIS